MNDEYAISLDLVTIFSFIGVNRNSWVEISPNKNGEPLTLSVVIIANDKPLKSEDTTNYLAQNYNSCIYEVKRLIGKAIREKEINELRKRLSFRITTPHSNIYDKKENFPEIKIERMVKL